MTDPARVLLAVATLVAVVVLAAIGQVDLALAVLGTSLLPSTAPVVATAVARTVKAGKRSVGR